MTSLEVGRTRTTPLALAWALALAAGLVVGILTSYLQAALPGSSAPSASFGSAWTVLAFAIAARTARTRSESVGAGLFAALGSVAGYYALASPLRDIATPWSDRLLWTLAAFVIGPLAGLAADLWTRGSRVQRVCAAVAVCGAVVGEALHAIARISAADAAAWVAFLGGTVTAAVVCRDVHDRREAILAAAVGAAVTLAVFGVYAAR